MIADRIKTKIKAGIKALGFCPMNEITMVKRTRKAPSRARYRTPFVENWAVSCDNVDHLVGATAIHDILEPAR